MERDGGDAIGKGRRSSSSKVMLKHFVLRPKYDGQVLRRFKLENTMFSKDFFGIFVKTNRGQE